MSSIIVVGPKREAQQIIDVLYHEGTIHLEDLLGKSPLEEDGLKKIDIHIGEGVNQLLLKVNGLLQLLPRSIENQADSIIFFKELSPRPFEEILQTIREQIVGLDTTIADSSFRKEKLELAITTLQRYARILKKLQPIEHQIPMLEGFEMTVLLIQKDYASIFDQTIPKLKEITHNQFDFAFADLDESTIAVITIFNRWYSREVHALLYSQNVNEVRIPPEYANMSLDEALKSIEQKQKEARDEIFRLDDELSQLSIRWFQVLSAMKQILEEKSEELEVFSKFAQTEYTFVLKGWIPRKFINKTRLSLEKHFENRVILSEQHVSCDEIALAPTFYDNPRWMKPFELFMRLSGVPKYQEVDPSSLIAIFFPIFFGIIVGDIGYGLCILALALVGRYKYGGIPWIRDLSGIFLISSIPTILFGLLFGEFFGDLGEMMGWIHPITLMGITWNRMEAMIPLLLLSIVIGVVHIFLGLFIGVVNAVACKNNRHLCEKCGMIIVILGILIAIVAGMNLVPEVLLLVGLLIMVAGLPLLFYGGGVRGMVEIMSTIGNILSYSRIMAIGMASVILALVANRLAGSVGIAVVGILIAVSLHLLNLVLGIFSPTIQSIRLHLVEFHSKFYEGGGRVYQPFGHELNRR